MVWRLHSLRHYFGGLVLGTDAKSQKGFGNPEASAPWLQHDEPRLRIGRRGDEGVDH